MVQTRAAANIAKRRRATTRNRHAETVYIRLKSDIFDFRLLPDQRFTESEVAARMGVSRTPVREALSRLQQENYIELMPYSGWRVKPFDFDMFGDLYDLRLTLELAAVRKLCAGDDLPELDDLREIWLVPKESRLTDGAEVARLDESFHETLVAAAGNREIARIFHDLSERIRIIRRLDFTKEDRVARTYEEHAGILVAILGRRPEQACMLLRAHIETSQAVVHQITLHMLHSARISPTADQ